MIKNRIEDVLRDRIAKISNFFHTRGRMPSFSEICAITGLRSKNAVHKLINKLECLNVLSKDDNGKLIPGSISTPLRVLGTVEAGFPSPAEESLLDTLSLDQFLIDNPEATYMLKVSGDSMIDAGIMPGDMVLVDKGRTPASGDVVIAEADGQWTMKYLKKRGDKVILLPANTKYKPIIPKNELKISGVVTAVIRKYK